MVSLDNTAGGKLELGGVEVEAEWSEVEATKFDLSLGLRETEEGLSGRLQYSEDLFDGVTIKRLVRHYERMLAEVVSDPGQRLSEIGLLTEAEEHQLIVEWNDTGSE